MEYLLNLSSYPQNTLPSSGRGKIEEWGLHKIVCSGLWCRAASQQVDRRPGRWQVQQVAVAPGVRMATFSQPCLLPLLWGRGHGLYTQLLESSLKNAGILLDFLLNSSLFRSSHILNVDMRNKRNTTFPQNSFKKLPLQRKRTQLSTAGSTMLWADFTERILIYFFCNKS